jgi:hypothetical protein
VYIISPDPGIGDKIVDIGEANESERLIAMREALNIPFFALEIPEKREDA